MSDQPDAGPDRPPGSADESRLTPSQTEEWILSRRGGKPIAPDALAWAHRALDAGEGTSR